MFDLPEDLPGLKSRKRNSSDLFIEAAVKDALKSDILLRQEPIEVRVDNGVVTLRGTVRDAGLRQKASALAAAAPGVREIVNRIDVADQPA